MRLTINFEASKNYLGDQLVMKKTLYILFCFFLIVPLYGQQYVSTGDFDRLSKASIGFGLNSYRGELRSTTDANLQAGLSVTLGYEHLFTQNVAIRTNFSLYNIKAADEKSRLPDKRDRNLSFEATNFEVMVQAMYYAFPHPRAGYLNRTFVNPFFFIGAGVTTNNAKAEFNGVKHKLRPLRTEGKDYGSLAVVIPIGAGLNFAIARNWDFQVEAQYNMALTGYLDDVSGVYLDPVSFTDNVAAALSDRRPELGLSPAEAGSPRGDGGNDGYIRLGFRLAYYLPKSLYGKSSIKCKVVKKTR